MKKNKLINIFNFIILFLEIYEISVILWYFFGTETFAAILMLPIKFLGKWLNIFLQLFFDKVYINIFLIPGVLLLMGVAEILLIMEKIQIQRLVSFRIFRKEQSVGLLELLYSDL